MDIEIRVEGVHKAFAAHVVLAGVGLEVRRGDVLAVVGGSGCGKTVLLDVMLGQLAVDRGRVLVANHDLPGAPLRDVAGVGEQELNAIHSHWGVVFQRNALFSGSVLDNLALPLREVRGLDDEALLPVAREALAAVGLPTTPEFLASDHERLSGGMAKRLAVARCVAMQPAVMFYDEPTTGLDPTSAGNVHDLIHATHEAPTPAGDRRTSVIVTHDKDLLRRLRPRVVMLHEGGVHFDGTFEAFAAADSPVIRPYFDQMPVLHQRPLAVAAGA